jgi:hypothetical protein
MRVGWGQNFQTHPVEKQPERVAVYKKLDLSPALNCPVSSSAYQPLCYALPVAFGGLLSHSIPNYKLIYVYIYIIII